MKKVLAIGTAAVLLSVYNSEKAFGATFKEAITEATALPTFMGSPES
ncbi:hypothetical protein TG4357_02679 [Thalassovita gelatinovora]|uniref:Uncharacterized protein n=1 Tax=Thalassovita gelatinovora TaxID=53501 RepID=A0A0P1FFD3_THAGE|nr:hypothetical protein [Thalassovita gelatinovora]QIZ79805.1 hypothetical protein HFZ77_04565 [Thalassovita gelatinovora]CUH66855.1 hypothetical protein TG4357_02679 [Thalassovita gelatinovora]SEQ43964.1 hypothetical protein SAMN04488043_105216 [Thalassovita gelatinovora]